MAIARDNSTTIVNPASGSNNPFTTAGTNRYLFVNVLDQNSSTSSVTYGGVSMSLLVSLNSSNISAGETCYFYGLANPASGSNNLVVTYTGANTIILDASSYTGAQQTTPIEASNTHSGNTASESASVTTLTDNDWLVGFARAATTITAGSNTSLVTNNSSRDFIDTNAAQTPAGTHSMSFTSSGPNNNTAITVAALKPFAAAVASSLVHNLGLLGVGQ
ncbi:MAG TPA: hypothetical protein VIY48_19070 [Candidatus Paceibacterota bacterium]